MAAVELFGKIYAIEAKIKMFQVSTTKTNVFPKTLKEGQNTTITILHGRKKIRDT